MTKKYEYEYIWMGRHDEGFTRLSNMASEGWRLVAINSPYAYMEREVKTGGHRTTKKANKAKEVE